MKKEKIKLINLVLDEHFPNPEIPLTHTNVFSLLIAVMLSAQCTDVKVNQVTPELFKNGDTPQDMVKYSLEEVEAILNPLGLFRTKAKNVLAISKILIESYNGQVPMGFELLEKLPGVGHKTASCVMAQGFKQPAFAVDTHIHRLAKKWKLSKARTVEETEKDLKKLFPREDWAKRHLQIIFYARAFCPARGHKIENCIICEKLSNLPPK